MVEILALPVRWGRPCGNLSADPVHAESHILVALSDVIGQDTVDPNVTVGGSHLDHRGASTHILVGEQKVVILDSGPSRNSHALLLVPRGFARAPLEVLLCVPWGKEEGDQGADRQCALVTSYRAGPV